MGDCAVVELQSIFVKPLEAASSCFEADKESGALGFLMVNKHCQLALEGQDPSISDGFLIAQEALRSGLGG